MAGKQNNDIGFDQLNLFGDNFEPEDSTQQTQQFGSTLKVVKAKFEESVSTEWTELFEGFDSLYAITFSSGIDFVNSVVGRFKHAEIIFGCEDVMGNELATIMAVQAKLVESLAKRKAAKILADKIAEGVLELYVSRDTKSHEKIFILHSEDGRSRVITGSANMSASAFCGLQRENIVCFDDENAFNYYFAFLKILSQVVLIQYQEKL